MKSGSYLIGAVKDSAKGKTETFCTGNTLIEKDVTIETNELQAKYSGQIDQLSNSLKSLIDREPELLNEMSRWIDYEINDFTWADIADKLWSLGNTVYGVSQIPGRIQDITKLLKDTQYFTDKTKAIGTVCASIRMIAKPMIHIALGKAYIASLIDSLTIRMRMEYPTDHLL